MDDFSIRLKLHKQSTVKSIAEIWSIFCGGKTGTGCMKFLKGGIQITEVNSITGSSCCFEIYTPMVYYNNICVEDGNTYCVYLSPSALYNSLKQENKNDNVCATIAIDRHNFMCKGMIVGKSWQDSEALLIQTKINAGKTDTFYNYYYNYYANMDPVAKIPLAAFSKMINKIKGNDCNFMVFSLDSHGLVNLKGYVELGNDHTYNKDLDDAMDMILGDEEFNPINYIIKVKTSEPWLGKLLRLSCESILSIYMDHINGSNPLVLKTEIPSLGMVFFSIESYKE